MPITRAKSKTIPWIDDRGFIHIGNAQPFKDVVDPLDSGLTRISHVVLDNAGQEKTIASSEE